MLKGYLCRRHIRCTYSWITEVKTLVDLLRPLSCARRRYSSIIDIDAGPSGRLIYSAIVRLLALEGVKAVEAAFRIVITYWLFSAWIMNRLTRSSWWFRVIHTDRDFRLRLWSWGRHESIRNAGRPWRRPRQPYCRTAASGSACCGWPCHQPSDPDRRGTTSEGPSRRDSWKLAGKLHNTGQKPICILPGGIT